MTIAIDFDGTCVTHEFPRIGKDIGAIPVLKQLVKNGHKLILNTMRCTREKAYKTAQDTTYYGDVLKEAIKWFEDNGILLYGINENPTQKYWTGSPKVFAHKYIDDANIGTPLIYPENKRPYVDWSAVTYLLMKEGLLTEEQSMDLRAQIAEIQNKL